MNINAVRIGICERQRLKPGNVGLGNSREIAAIGFQNFIAAPFSHRVIFAGSCHAAAIITSWLPLSGMKAQPSGIPRRTGQ